MGFLGSSGNFYKVGWSPLCFSLCTAFLKLAQTSHSGFSSPLLNFPVADSLHFLSWELLPSSMWEPSTHFPLFFHVLYFWMQMTHPNHLSTFVFQLILTSLVLGSICLGRCSLHSSSHFTSVYCLWTCTFLPGSHFLKRQIDISFIHCFGPLSHVLSILSWPQSPIVVLRGSCPSCVSRKQIFPPRNINTRKKAFSYHFICHSSWKFRKLLLIPRVNDRHFENIKFTKLKLI